MICLPQTTTTARPDRQLVNQQSKNQKLSRNLVRFTQRQLRESFAWGDHQIRHHLKRLLELEYVLAHRTGHGNAKRIRAALRWPGPRRRIVLAWTG